MEVFLRELFKRRELIHTRVVDENVNRTERPFRLCEERSISGFFATSACTATARPPLLVISSTTLSAPALLEA